MRFRNHALTLIGLLAVTVSSAVPVLAQTQPQPYGQQPYGEQQPPQQQQARPYGDEYYLYNPLYATEPYNAYVRDYPAAEVRAVPGARAITTATRWQYHYALSDLNTAVRGEVRQFDRSPELRDAIAAEDQAYQALLEARNRALGPLADDENYQAHRELQQRLAENIRDAHEADDVRIDQIRAAAELKLAQAQAARAREQELLSGDEAVADAQQQLREAHRRVVELREQFDEAVRNDPELIQARRDVRDARLAHLVAAAYLDAVLDARDIAMTYAYWLHRDGQSKVAPYLPYGGYNYGYGGYGGYGYHYPRVIVGGRR